jgi:hypothetical protein
VVIGTNLGPAMNNADIYPSIDLEVALKMLHRMHLEDGDLGAQYWNQVTLLLKDAAEYRLRALAAERKLAYIQAVLDESDFRAQESI